MLNTLNSPQLEAVETLSGPLLVLAGAGTGKTRVVTFRIANLIRHKVPADRILAVTFTNKAAKEMQQRSLALLKRKKDGPEPEISTFHSLCLKILRRNITQLGYPKHFSIYDRGDQEGVARATLREIRVPNETLRPGDLLYFIGAWKTASIRPEQAESMAQTDKEHLAAMGYRRYQKALKAAGAVDFDDLLLLTEALFQKFPKVRREEAQRFDHLMIDEYQDTNQSQYRIVKALADGHRNLCVVGDDDQSIYGWRGAEVEHILRFAHDWPNAKVVRLEDNYRSTSAILELANRVISYNKTRHPKTLRAARPGGQRPKMLQFIDENDEAESVVEDIQQALSDPMAEPGDFAILFRTNEQPRAFEAELRRKELPYVLIGGMSFYDRKEVKDILAYLKLLAKPDDEVAALRIINKPPRGIGQSTVTALMEKAVTEGVPIWELFSQAANYSEIPANTAKSLRQFQQMILHFHDRLKTDSILQVASDFIQQLDYQKELNRQYKKAEDVEARWNSVEEVINALSTYQQRAKMKATMQGFLDEIALGNADESSDKEKQLDRNAIVLMTLHSAKGLEYPQVYMVGMEEGLLPHHRSVKAEGDAIEEERRLCYVGITRAQERLTFTLALSRRKWGKPRPTDPSRFLFEITGQADNLHGTAAPKGKPKRKTVKKKRTSKSPAKKKKKRATPKRK